MLYLALEVKNMDNSFKQHHKKTELQNLIQDLLSFKRQGYWISSEETRFIDELKCERNLL